VGIAAAASLLLQVYLPPAADEGPSEGSAPPAAAGGGSEEPPGESPTARARRLGSEGEQAVRSKYDIGPKVQIRVNGKTYVPDGLKADALSEVKNVAKLNYTQQLRAFAQFAKDNGLRFDLYVRPGAELSGPLEEAIANKLVNPLPIP